MITDSAGNIKSESDYYPWGGELQFVNNDSNHYKFTGKERDSESGLDYFGARSYSNGLGRFISADWSATPAPVPFADLFEPQSLNLYSYVAGNPASKADADGHQEKGLVPYKEAMNPLNYKPQSLTESLKGAFHDLLKTISSSSLGAIRFSDSLTSNTNGDQEFGGMLMSGALMLLPGAEEDEAAMSAAKAFGFDKAIGGGKLFYGEFKNGAAGAFEFSSKGGELNIGVSFLTKISAETFNNIEKGAVNAAKASGSDSVTIEARMVKNPELQKFFKRHGFAEQLGKDGKGTGTFTKKIPVNPAN